MTPDTPWTDEARNLVASLPARYADLTIRQLEAVGEFHRRLADQFAQQYTVASGLRDELIEFPEGATFGTHGSPEQLARANRYGLWSADVERARQIIDAWDFNSAARRPTLRLVDEAA